MSCHHFEYFSEIEVYDSAPKSYLDALEGHFSAKVTGFDNELRIKIKDQLPDRNTLIKTYNAIRNNYKDREREYLTDMYFRSSVGGYNYSYVEFALGYYVLLELKIIYLENNIIRFSMEKKDLAQSEILKLSGEKI